MKRRREHGECHRRPNGHGCLVFGTPVCTYRKPEPSRAEKFKTISFKVLGKVGILLWWLSLALLGAGVAWGWMERERRTEALIAGAGNRPGEIL